MLVLFLYVGLDFGNVFSKCVFGVSIKLQNSVIDLEGREMHVQLHLFVRYFSLKRISSP